MSDEAIINGVKASEIRAFRTSIASRRFPALRQMHDEDIAALVIADKKVNKQKVIDAAKEKQASNAAHPSPVEEFRRQMFSKSHDGSIVPKAASPSKQRPPFSPCNPSAAKDAIHRKGEEPFSGSLAPYEKCQTRDPTVHGKPPFVPTSASVAKGTIQINYYLNSPDEDTLSKEKKFIQERATRNTEELLKTHGRILKEDELAAEEA